MGLPALEREQEWLRSVAATTAAWLLTEAVTGLWLMLGPFGDVMQVMTLIHTVSGMALTIPWVWYLATHWFRRRDARALSQAGATGYLALLSSLVLIISGVVITVQSLWGVRMGGDVASFPSGGHLYSHCRSRLPSDYLSLAGLDLHIRGGSQGGSCR